MDTAKIKDWHAHVYFDAITTAPAQALREKIEKAFAIEMGRFHERPVGPHPRFSYQVAFKNEQLAPLLSWLAPEQRAPHDLVKEKELIDGFAPAAGEEGRRETEGPQGNGRHLRILGRRPDLRRAAGR